MSRPMISTIQYINCNLSKNSNIEISIMLKLFVQVPSPSRTVYPPDSGNVWYSLKRILLSLRINRMFQATGLMMYDHLTEARKV